MTYRIESGVPLPFNVGGTGRALSPETAAVRALEVGQSVVLPVTSSTKNCVYWSGRKLGRKFVTRTIGNNQCRVWRFA